jgi:hypothetical protein
MAFDMVDEELYTTGRPRAVAFRRAVVMVVVAVVAVVPVVSVGFIVAAIVVAIVGVEAGANIRHAEICGVDIFAGRGRLRGVETKIT